MQKRNLFSSFNLAMLNLWLSLCRGDPGLPHVLRHLGYKGYWIEYEFQNAAGETVKPELIIASDTISHTVLLEWKQGPNTEDDQLRRYSKVTQNDLLGTGMLNAQCVSAHDVCIVGLSENCDRLRIGIVKGAYGFPLVGVDDDGLVLRENRFAAEELNREFGSKLSIDMSLVPVSLVPFDHESEDWRVAESVLPQIVAYMTRLAPRFTLDQLMEDCTPVVKTMLAPGYLRDLKGKVLRVVVEAARNEFKGYVKQISKSRRKASSPTWEITWNPLALPFDKRTAEAKKLERLCGEFIEALRSGKRELSQMSFDEYAPW